MTDFKKRLNSLIREGDRIYSLFDGKNFFGSRLDISQWMNDVQIFCDNCLKGYPLEQRMRSLLFHRRGDATDVGELLSCLKSIQKDTGVVSKMSGISTDSGLSQRTEQLSEYDVFHSHANKDKEELVEELYQSLSKLGVKIFYDKESLEWGDKWKERILDGTRVSEFAIIVISENYFDREWTERELSEFLARQNADGQKLILPILHRITSQQLQEKYPSVADIQGIRSADYTCDQIALLFAKQLIKRLKSI